MKTVINKLRIKERRQLYIKRRTLSTTGFSLNREQFSTNISKVKPLTEVNIDQKVEYLLSIIRFTFEYLQHQPRQRTNSCLPPIDQKSIGHYCQIYLSSLSRQKERETCYNFLWLARGVRITFSFSVYFSNKQLKGI